MWLRLSERAKKAVAFAQDEARGEGENGLNPDLVVLGCLREDDGVVAELLARLGVDRDRLRTQVESLPAENAIRSDELIELAEKEARALSNPYVGPEHLLLGALRDGRSRSARAMTDIGAGYDAMREAVASVKNQKKL